MTCVQCLLTRVPLRGFFFYLGLPLLLSAALNPHAAAFVPADEKEKDGKAAAAGSRKSDKASDKSDAGSGRDAKAGGSDTRDKKPSSSTADRDKDKDRDRDGKKTGDSKPAAAASGSRKDDRRSVC